MVIRILPITILALLFMHASNASALTAEQFSNLCHSAPGQCSDHAIAQAYVGGALDLLATLDEETDYLDKLYCKEPKELFDVPAIIRFMQAHREEYAKRNAMLLVVRYLEVNGGCEIHE